MPCKDYFILSNSHEYKVVFKKFYEDDSAENERYIVVQLIRIRDDSIIYEYKQMQYKGKRSFNNFIVIGDNDWWVSWRNYKLKLFVNCDTGEVFDDPLNMENSDDYVKDKEFIWTGPYNISSDDKYLLMDGYVPGSKPIKRLYDVSEISKGVYREVLVNDYHNFTFFDELSAKYKSKKANSIQTE